MFDRFVHTLVCAPLAAPVVLVSAGALAAPLSAPSSALWPAPPAAVLAAALDLPGASSATAAPDAADATPGSVRGENSAAARSQMDAPVRAHFDSIAARALIEFLAPRGWRVRFDVAGGRLDRRVVFHAETTRRRALDELLDTLGLGGVFYPGAGLILIFSREDA